ncbi:hypothetical protein ABGB18_27615 [Nonomuraea sp. B12E4]|uniref:hypothetical protein n=1 Tax=Nonomuraea sp. B12E4 TaxID=3153564 RepID=UPI00325CB916
MSPLAASAAAMAVVAGAGSLVPGGSITKGCHSLRYVTGDEAAVQARHSRDSRKRRVI